MLSSRANACDNVSETIVTSLPQMRRIRPDLSDNRSEHGHLLDIYNFTSIVMLNLCGVRVVKSILAGIQSFA